MNNIQKKNVFMILGVLMKTVFVLYLGTEHFIFCLHFDILAKAAYLRRSESVSDHQGWNDFSRATRAGILIMHHGDAKPKQVSIAFGCWHLAGFHIPGESPSQGYLGLWLWLAYWGARGEKPFEPSYISISNQFFFLAYNFGRNWINRGYYLWWNLSLPGIWIIPLELPNQAALFVQKYGGSSNLAIFATPRTVLKG